jgi:hypothetical protein
MVASLGVSYETFAEDNVRIRYHETTSENKVRRRSVCASEKTIALISESVINNLSLGPVNGHLIQLPIQAPSIVSHTRDNMNPVSVLKPRISLRHILVLFLHLSLLLESDFFLMESNLELHFRHRAAYAANIILLYMTILIYGEGYKL